MTELIKREPMKDAGMVIKEKTVACGMFKPTAHVYLKKCLKCEHNGGGIIEITPARGLYPAQEAVTCKFPKMVMINNIIEKGENK